MTDRTPNGVLYSVRNSSSRNGLYILRACDLTSAMIRKAILGERLNINLLAKLIFVFLGEIKTKKNACFCCFVRPRNFI
jgi:hypothetical protein